MPAPSLLILFYHVKRDNCILSSLVCDIKDADAIRSDKAGYFALSADMGAVRQFKAGL